MRDYAAFTTLVVTKLQSAGTVDYSVAEVDYQIEESLKEFSAIKSHVVPVVFQFESRTGDDVTGTASTLTDTQKAQFLTTDPTNEKVVHNVTDNTWAVILARTSSSIVTLSADIMDANERYEIFNKHCTNKRQIFIGDMVEYPEIERVEYPRGTQRNFKMLGDVLEVDVDFIPDSNTNVDNLPDVDVYVWFKRPQILSQLTDWAGIVANSAGYAAGVTTMAASSLQAAGTIEIGEEFYLENQRTLYVISAAATIASNTTAISFYPGLEAAASSAEVISFRKSSLSPQDEEILAELVVGRLMQNKAPKFVNKVATGGTGTWSDFYSLGERRAESALRKLRMSIPAKTRRRYSTE